MVDGCWQQLPLGLAILHVAKKDISDPFGFVGLSNVKGTGYITQRSAVFFKRFYLCSSLCFRFKSLYLSNVIFGGLLKSEFNRSQNSQIEGFCWAKTLLLRSRILRTKFIVTKWPLQLFSIRLSVSWSASLHRVLIPCFSNGSFRVLLTYSCPLQNGNLDFCDLRFAKIVDVQIR